MHAGDWNISPQAIPNLMDALHKPPFSYEVRIAQRDIFASDPDLDLLPADLYTRQRRLLVAQGGPRRPAPSPGADSTLFADAACGSPRLRRRLPTIRRQGAA